MVVLSTPHEFFACGAVPRVQLCTNFGVSLRLSNVVTKRQKPKCWIFQSSPTKYDLLGDIKTGEPDPYWSANQFRTEMSVGDKIFFRISGNKKGLYATGTISSLPFLKSDEFGNWKVKLRFDGLIDPPLLRSETAKILSLKNFRPLVGAEGTNFKVPVSIARKIEQLIKTENRVIREIKRGVEILPPLKNVPHKVPPADISDNRGKRRKPSQEQIRRVEQAAVTVAMKYFFKEGLSMIEDCQQKGVGYDFVFADKKERLHVEVKGVSGSKIDFNLTPKELKCAKNDRKWKLLVVTDALIAPKAKLFSGKELLAKAKAIEPSQYRVTF